MNNTTLSCFVFFLSTLLLPAPLFAQENDDPDLGDDFIESPEWEEADIILPPFPDRDELLKLDVDRVDMPFNFYIDPASLSISKDGVSRYTTVIESNSGASNIMYEGIRCSTSEYRTYAYGTYDNKFSKARVNDWKKISISGAMAHRYNLKRYYLCNDLDRQLSVSESLQRIRYPEDFATGGSHEF